MPATRRPGATGRGAGARRGAAAAVARWRRRRACAAQRRSHDGAELPQVHRLGQVVVGAGLQRLDGVLGRAVGGDDDAFSPAAGLVDAAQQIQPGAVGQPHVGDDELVAAGSAQQRQASSTPPALSTS
jgi:hypothetical protein